MKTALFSLIMALSGICLNAQVALADFMDLWLTPDQRGRMAFENEDYNKAAQYFENKYWKALSFYHAKKYAAVTDILKTATGLDEQFLKGNAYARMEELKNSISAYNAVLTIDPDHKETRFNLKWVTGLYEQDQKKYDDAGGTGGKLGADRSVQSNLSNEQGSEVSTQQLKAEGFTDEQLREMWMRRVDTTFGDFLRLRFAYQLQRKDADLKDSVGSGGIKQ